jgi:hypothetical protein
MAISMKHIKIDSENPLHHWYFLDVKDKKVLDLGCGKHLLEDGMLTTPEFFLRQGAKSVIGVDPHVNDIEWFKTNITNGQFFVDCIKDVSQLDFYLNMDVQAVKIDIEGHENCLLQTTNLLTHITDIAIETHNRELFHDILIKLVDLNFTITHIATFYPRVYPICNVICGSKL